MKTDIQFLTYVAQFFLEWEIFRTEVVEEMKTHFLFPITLFENRTVYKIMWKNFVEPVRSQMPTWSMRIACWIPKATRTQSQHVILIVLPLQQWLKERASLLRWYVNCVFCKIWQQRYILAPALILDRWNACGTKYHQIPARFWHHPGLFMQDITIRFLVTWF